MTEEIIGSLKWLADLLGKAWEPKAAGDCVATAPIAETPTDTTAMSTDVAPADARRLVGVANGPDHLTAA